MTETVYYVSDEFVRVVNTSGTYDFAYVKHEGQRVGELKPDSTKIFIHGDHLGSTQLISDESGNGIENSSFSPFGVITDGGNQSRYSYTGKELDGIISVYDFNARTYSANLAKFIQSDKVIQNAYNPQDLNHYAYARNNPYKYVDSTGKDLIVVDQPLGGYGAGHTYGFVGNDKTGYTKIELDKAGPATANVDVFYLGSDEEGKPKKYELGSTEISIVYSSDEEQDKRIIAEAKKYKDKGITYLIPHYTCDRFISRVANAGNVKYNVYSSIPNLNFQVNQIIQMMRSSGSSALIFGSEGKRGYFPGLGYVTSEGHTYPTSNPNWSPNQNAPRYTPLPQSPATKKG